MEELLMELLESLEGGQPAMLETIPEDIDANATGFWGRWFWSGFTDL